MEKQPSIHRRDDEFLDGSTVHRPPVRDALIPESTTAAASLPVGSTFSTNLPSSPSLEDDDAKTVIRRPDNESGFKGIAASVPTTPASVASVLLGTRLNHFLLEEMIGGGGMGAVFRARDDRLDRIVAIKVIPFVGEDQDMQRRFRNEAQNAARLDHPYIARVFDVGQFEQWHYLVFEFVDGINLRDMVARDGVLPIDDAVYYTRQIAEAIEHANGRGIVHRDIKPSNVLVDTEGNVKVVDMGLARSQQIEVTGDMTASGVTLGTFDYISPEQARDPRDADVRSDIYSLGCTLYYMLTASPPYPGGTMLQKLLSHGNAPPPDPRGLRPEVSDNLTAIIHKMLAKDPAARYPRAIDVVADLRELALREGLVRAQSRGTLTVTPSDPIPQVLSRHLPWIVAAALLVAIAAGLKVSSAIDRGNFLISQPPSAAILRSEKPNQSTNRENPSTKSASSGDVVADESGAKPVEDTTSLPSAKTPKKLPSDGDASLPPQFTNVAMPSESGRKIATSDDTGAPSTIPIQRIIVGDSSSDPSAKVVQDLRDAIRLADELQVNLIEISASTIVSEPITITRDRLVIRSMIGRSEIRFVTNQSISMERVKMLDIGSHPIDMQGIDFSWSVRSEGFEGGTLFGIDNANGLVKLANCTITIENLAERDEVFAFEIAEPDDVVVEKSAPSPFPLVVIQLENVSARGEMTFINLVDAAPLQFEWANGLLAISRRMLEASGARVQPELGRDQIQIKLDQVTAWTPDGLARMRLGPSGAFPMMIDRNSTRSVFHNAPTSSHIEFAKLDGLEVDPSRLVQLRGEDNAYDGDHARDLRLLVLGQGSNVTSIFRREDVALESLAWFTERSPHWSVRWKTPPESTTSPSRLTTIDFFQEGTLSSGFDVNFLPDFPSRILREPEI